MSEPHDKHENPADAPKPIIGFVAGTPIRTPEGSKPFEDVKPGDLIVSRPDDGGEASEPPRPGPRRRGWRGGSPRSRASTTGWNWRGGPPTSGPDSSGSGPGGWTRSGGSPARARAGSGSTPTRSP